MISDLFNEVLFRPLFNALVLIYNLIPGQDFGVAIIILTILVRLAFYPLSQKAIKSQKALSELQPEIKKIQKKYKNEKEKQAQELMKLYKEKKINPAAGCLPILLQLPVLIALFQVLRRGLQPETLNYLYSFVSAPEKINALFLGFLDLSQASLVLAVLAGIAQFFQGKMMAPAKSLATDKKNFATALNKQMIYTMPIITVLIASRFPAGLALYWLVNNLFAIFQQYLVIIKKRDKG